MSVAPPVRDTSTVPTYDESEWPIFYVRMPPVALSAEGFEAHLDRCSKLYTRGQRFCMLIDMADHPPLGPVRRKAVADRMVEDGRRHRGVMLGCALVVRSPTSRGGVTAINWIARPEYPFTAFEDVEEAKKWIAQLLEGHRVTLRPRASRFPQA